MHAPIFINLRKWAVTFKLASGGGYPERGGGFPQERGGSNLGGNYVSYFRPGNIAKSLKEQLFYRTPPEAVTYRCSSKYVFLKKFCNLHKKALALESIFKKLVGWRIAKKTPSQLFSCEVLGTPFLTEHLR